MSNRIHLQAASLHKTCFSKQFRILLLKMPGSTSKFAKKPEKSMLTVKEFSGLEFINQPLSFLQPVRATCSSCGIKKIVIALCDECEGCHHAHDLLKVYKFHKSTMLVNEIWYVPYCTSEIVMARIACISCDPLCYI